MAQCLTLVEAAEVQEGNIEIRDGRRGSQRRHIDRKEGNRPARCAGRESPVTQGEGGEGG